MSNRRSVLGIAINQYIAEKPPRPPLIAPVSQATRVTDIIHKVRTAEHVIFPYMNYRLWLMQSQKSFRSTLRFWINNH